MHFWDLSAIPFDLIPWTEGQESFISLGGHLSHGSLVLAQRFDNVDLLGDIQKSFQHFIKSGQVWALGIGIVLGYMFRSFTAY